MRGSAMALAALAAMAAPVMGQERCPGRQDLEQGIAVTYADGTVSVFRATDRPEVLAVEVLSPGGSAMRTEVAHGIYRLSATTGEGDSALRTEYDRGAPPEMLPAPAPGTTSFAEAVTQGPAGEGRSVEGRRYGALGQVSIGGCAYQGLEMTAVIEDRRVVAFGGWVLPELGFFVGRWTQPAGAARMEIDVVTIGALR